MTTPAARAKTLVSFGPFSLIESERLLTRDGAPVDLSARTLDILIALVSRPNEVVSKKELLARVWPDVTVEEGSLRFHIASLRKALGDGRDGARYITTMAGRGYCFVAPVSQSSDQGRTLAAAAGFPHANLPSRLIGMVGRDDDVLKLSARLTATRFVTIVGSGGVGKTTVAVAVGHHLIEAFAGAVLFVDLGMLSDPDLVATAVASMLGLSVQSDDRDAQPDRVSAGQANPPDPRHLRTSDRGGGGISRHASSWLRRRSTSWRPAARRFRSRGEHVYRLDPLACPPDDPELTAAVAQTFPATRLFVERAVASGARLDLSDAEAAIVAGICRKLDGVALAIELAATTGRGLRPAADRGASRPAPDPAVAGAAHRAAAAKDPARHAGLELRAAFRAGTRGASPARRIRWTFYARCGAGRRDERDHRSVALFSAPSTAWSPSRWSRPARSGP